MNHLIFLLDDLNDVPKFAKISRVLTTLTCQALR